ncbi:hypothetical protein Sru01_56680 [Sphaerisporangium rufum]|uniref:Glycosyltransferase family 4 protein n=1 Tax=Sphaerisporangium rufum TaxID=1381558 RepID=A0A919R931_9ACTN|nr:glycosyltransferase family 4 protein [Sphaerisporangium rufum]GII80686.1 hypothetical protein Sru01_56680 [Sphaerisporangium rufum]
MAANTLTTLTGKLTTAVARVALWVLALLNRRRARAAGRPDSGPVRILLLHANGMGGTIRTVLNLAGHLAARREVEIVSALRTAERPFFDIPPGVRVTYLDDRTAPGGPVARLLSRIPALLVPEGEKARKSFTLRTELRLIAYLRAMDSGVVIATRPAFTLLTALFAPPEVITVGQEHVTLDSHPPALRRLIRRRYGRFDAFVTLTEADRERYARLLRGDPPGRLLSIPNAVPELDGGVSPLSEKTVVAMGRLAHAKGFDRLVNAWRTVAERHPDWTLRIYGGGPRERHERLQERIDRAGLAGKVVLMGRTATPGAELAQASIHVVSSRYEGFGMAILEAMSKGLPVVSFDCPFGPREIITDGRDGLLVRSKKAADLAEGVCRLIEDEDLRRRLGRAALRTAGRYDLATVGARWEALLGDLAAARSGIPLRRPAPAGAGAPRAAA